jgi:hypothetical protein
MNVDDAFKDLPPLSAYQDIRPNPPAFILVRARDMEFKEPDFIIADLLETDTLALAFGDPGCGKSFLGVDIAASVARGSDFHGKAVKQGAVVYIAGEGHNGLKRRQSAWEKHNGLSLDDAPLFFSRVAANFLDAASAEAVACAVDEVAKSEGAPRLVVIDTLARNFGAGDENQTSDMNRFVSAIDDLKARYHGCSVLIIHHTGHGDKQRGRGAMSLKGALDAEYRVEKNESEITVTNTKMKDAAEPDPLTFKLLSVELGLSSNGRPITSAVLALGEPTSRPGRHRLTPAIKMALESFKRAKSRAGLADDLSASVHVEDWRPVFYEMSTADNTSAKKVAFGRARTKLVEGGDLSVADDCYRYARIPD